MLLCLCELSSMAICMSFVCNLKCIVASVIRQQQTVSEMHEAADFAIKLLSAIPWGHEQNGWAVTGQ